MSDIKVALTEEEWADWQKADSEIRASRCAGVDRMADTLDDRVVLVNPTGDVLHTGHPCEAQADEPGVADQVYRVVWVVNVRAGTPQEAAHLAYQAQTNPLTLSTAYNVYQNGKPVAVVDCLRDNSLGH